MEDWVQQPSYDEDDILEHHDKFFDELNKSMAGLLMPKGKLIEDIGEKAVLKT